MEPAPGDALSRGKSCFRDCQWLEAHRLLLRADAEDGLTAPDLELLAEAAYLIGDEEEALEHFERAHRAHLEAGDPVRAARCGFWIGMHSVFRGDMGRASGWFGRAGSLLEGHPDAVEHGYLMLPGVHVKLAAGDVEGAVATAAAARDLGVRHGDAELVAVAMHLQGRATIAAGRVQEGLSLLDETMVAVLGDELSSRVAGLIYCSVIEGCHEVSAVDRAGEWTEALTRFCERQPTMQSFTGKCLIHRAEIMQLQGDWQDAIVEARRACERFERGQDSVRPAAAHYQQGEVHRLRGEHDAAEAAYLRAGEMGADPQPGLALLRLAQGRAEAAVAAIARALSAAEAPLSRARMLPAQVEILLATGDVEGAQRAADELCEIATRFDTEVIVAAAETARGAVELARGQVGEALRS
ncbi:MAG: tetratricopeptide repeat protein, partial [Myxococcales bacterium]